MKSIAKVIVASALLMGLTQGSYAQNDPGYSDSWYIGGGVGANYSMMRFSDLNKDRFPSKEGMLSPLYSVFVQGEFGAQHNFVVRPQLSFLWRGGKLTEIDKFDAYPKGVEDINYRVKSYYLDVRLPLLYQFGKASCGVRPYLGVTPIAGFSLGGDIRLHEENTDFSVAGYEVDLNKSNFNSVYLAVAPTIGVRFNFRTGRKAQNVCFVNLEASYEIGLTDTYGSKEKDGEAFDVVSGSNYAFDGTRKFSGFNVQAMVGIPFSAFKRCKEEAPRETYVEPAYVAPAPVVEEKPCYTLDEINDLMAQGQSVRGKTICAISDINFDFAKSNIQPQSYPYLNKLAQTIIRTNTAIEVRGHTDNVGSDEVNLNLSKQRAEAVVSYLVKQGVNRNNLSYSYYGASRPLTSNDTEDGRTMNRRVEFVIR